MQRYVLIISCMLLTLYAYSQPGDAYRRDSLHLPDVTRLSFTLDGESACALPLRFPFKTIQVEDVRFDTSQIAIHSYLKNKALVPYIENDKINTDGPTAISLTNYFNHFYRNNLNNNDDTELVCFIKKLKCNKKDTILEGDYANSAYGEIKIAAEVFLHAGDAYYAAFKIDTTLVKWVSVGKKEFAITIRDFLLMPALQAFEHKLNNTSWNLTLTKKAFTKEEVYKHYYDERFKIPILYQPYKEGLYASPAEFANNAPSLTNVRLGKKEKGTTALLDAEGNRINDTHIFGYCDGKIIWLLKSSGYCPLIRTGNCFYYFMTYSGVRQLDFVDFDY